MSEHLQQCFAAHALLPQGWQRHVLLRWNAQGQLTQVLADQTPPQGVAQADYVIPGLPNLHSHAFQRAFSGLTEYRGQAQDSFWSWRQLMYGFAQRISPEMLRQIATWLYAEMLEAGYTSVCEFHYVHHQPGGQPYASPTAMCEALLDAAQTVGMGLTLLPVLYQSSGFGGQPAREDQRRFLQQTEALLGWIEALAPRCAAQGAAIGLAPHSLRAVPPQSLQQAVAGLHALLPQAPVHIHIAEQVQEVQDCLVWSGQRPVKWLLDHAPVDARWCLVHATHMTPDEYAGAARSGAVAGLCPTTEANLGDGIFDLPQWLAHGGRWGVGSDSHVCVNAAEELMLLEYGQRLQLRQRNVGASASQPAVATALLQQAVAGGAQASARPIAGLAVGQQADFVVLSADHVALAGLDADQALAGHVFASQRSSAIEAVWVAGQQRVTRGRHALHADAARDFLRVRQQMLAVS